jgi:hypothetical protein
MNSLSSLTKKRVCFMMILNEYMSLLFVVARFPLVRKTNGARVATKERSFIRAFLFYKTHVRMEVSI